MAIYSYDEMRENVRVDARRNDQLSREDPLVICLASIANSLGRLVEQIGPARADFALAVEALQIVARRTED